MYFLNVFFSEKLEEAKEIQSFRRKPGGIRSALNLNTYANVIYYFINLFFVQCHWTCFWAEVQ